MADAVDFSGSNRLLRAPEGREGDVSTLHVFHNGQCSVSCWQLGADELQQIMQDGGKVWLSVLYPRGTQPPVFLGSRELVRQVVADYGPLWREEAPGNAGNTSEKR